MTILYKGAVGNFRSIDVNGRSVESRTGWGKGNITLSTEQAASKLEYERYKSTLALYEAEYTAMSSKYPYKTYSFTPEELRGKC